MNKKIKFLFILLISILTLPNIIFANISHKDWSGDRNEPYTVINKDIPYFSEVECKNTLSFENYSELDDFGRIGVCFANIGKDLMPKTGEKRESISKIIPSGWMYNKKTNNKKYDFIPGKYIFNRCHAIGWQLTAENANNKNLFTGTQYLNIIGMKPAETDVASYIKKTNNHVLYRVTPIYEKDNLVAEGVRIEAYSVEDNGEGICFNRFYYNIQPGIEISYKTGENWLKTEDINSYSNNQQETIDHSDYIDNIEPYFRKIGETNPPIPKFSDEALIQEGLENTKEPVITTTTEDITDTIKIREETSKEKEITAIDEQIESAITTIKIIFPIIISTMILIFVVLFTDKILKRKKKKK